MPNERSNITDSFAERVKFQEKWLLHTLYILKMLCIRCSMEDVISLLLSYIHFGWIVPKRNIKKKKNRIRTLYILKIQVSPRYHCFFHRAPRFSRINDVFIGILGKHRQNYNQQTGFMILSTLKLLYVGCSTKGVTTLLFSWTT